MEIMNKSIRFRITICLILSVSVAFTGILRVFAVSAHYDSEQASSNTRFINIENGRGMIYDCLGYSLYNSKKYAVVFLPCDESYNSLQEYFNGNELESAKKQLMKNNPIVTVSDIRLEKKGIYSYEICNRDELENSLEHIIGYVNGENHGVTGIEKGYDSVLYCKDKKYVCASVDGKGNFLLGIKPSISSQKSDGAVYLTIDKELQKICFNALKNVKSGAVVMTETKTGKIKAIVSVPSYDISRVKDYLNDSEKPLINRALSCYNVGSVFKPLIAATLIENNKQNFIYKCTGSCIIGGRKFFCHKHSGHGIMSIADAVEQSCNTYFYNAACQIDPQQYIDTATALGFCDKLELANGIKSFEGSMENPEIMKSLKAAVANFAIGQGKVMLSPVAITNLYSAIANGGYYYNIYLVDGVYNNGKYQNCEKNEKNIVFGSNTACLLKSYLSNVLKFGTGKDAMPQKISACGKTATAQTGKFSGKTEKTHSWFCGFFPAENPRYTVTVFIENANLSNIKSATVFKNIADNTISLKK